MAGKIIAKFMPESSVMYKVTLYINGVKQEEKIGSGETKEYIIDKDSEIRGSMGGIKTPAELIYDNNITELVFNYKKGMWKNTFDVTQVNVTPISDNSAETTTEKPVFFFDGGKGDKLTVYEDRLIIKHKGVANVLAMGIHGDKTIYYTDLTAIQYKPASSILNGHLQFTLIGGNESKGGVLSAASDENTIIFVSEKNSDAEKIHKYLNNKLREIKTSRNTPIIQTAPAASAADELKKFKELLDMGIISQEEFDAKKKQLLGL